MTNELPAAIDRFQSAIERRDRADAELFLDEGFQLVLVMPSQVVFSRARWLDVLPDYVVHEYDVDDQVVEEDAEMAAVMHRVRMKATVLGADRSGVFVISDFWRKREGVWKLWQRHSTPLSAGALPVS